MLSVTCRKLIDSKVLIYSNNTIALTQKNLETRLSFALDSFTRLAKELNLTERQLFIEANIDLSILSQQRGRIKKNLPVSGFSVLAIIKLLERFPGLNVNAFFKEGEPFFGTTEKPLSGSSEDLLKTSTWQVRYFEKSKMVEALELRIQEQSSVIAMLQELLKKVK